MLTASAAALSRRLKEASKRMDRDLSNNTALTSLSRFSSKRVQSDLEQLKPYQIWSSSTFMSLSLIINDGWCSEPRYGIVSKETRSAIAGSTNETSDVLHQNYGQPLRIVFEINH